MDSKPNRHWHNLIPLTIVILVLAFEAHTGQAPEEAWIYLSVMVIPILMLLFLLNKGKVAGNNPTNLMLKSLDASIGIMFLAAGALFASGLNELATPILSTLEKCTPLLIAWWVVVYKRQPERVIVYLLFVFIWFLLFSARFHGWSAAEFLVLGILEAAVVRIALSTLQAETLNLDSLERGASETIDPVTGFLLPATFEAELALVAALADRKQSPFSLLAWEIDGYRAYVNQFGTTAGEKLMRLTALSIGDCLRISDTVGRWEDERFLGILPETTAADAHRVVDKIGQLVALIEAVDKGPVTLRFAIAEHHLGDDPLAVVERVEKALTECSGKPNRPAQVISFA